MTDSQILQHLMASVDRLEGRFDTLEGKFDTLEGKFDTLGGKVDSIATELHEFKESQAKHNLNMEDHIGALWTLSNQSFEGINNIHPEVVSPWKLRQHRNAA